MLNARETQDRKILCCTTDDAHMLGYFSCAVQNCFGVLFHCIIGKVWIPRDSQEQCILLHGIAGHAQNYPLFFLSFITAVFPCSSSNFQATH